ncbi:hypothetical protein [Rhodococcus sp. NPDC059234]|uniref:hypothetical protein n=1 Tax=Rhodococcus sp. NPDC059234 TaxID=3346781 RepID=UPI00366BDA2A
MSDPAQQPTRASGAEVTPAEASVEAMKPDHVYAPLEFSELDVEQAMRMLDSAAEELRAARRRFLRLGLAFVAACIAAAITILALLLTQSAVSQTGGVLSTVLTALIALLAATLGYYFGTQEATHSGSVHLQVPSTAMSSLEAELLNELRDLEVSAGVAIGTRGRPATASEFIPELVELGLWDATDAQEFRSILRARNQVVHRGRDSNVTHDELKRAVVSAHRLRDQIQQD